jgi:hypothetical protein
LGVVAKRIAIKAYRKDASARGHDRSTALSQQGVDDSYTPSQADAARDEVYRNSDRPG